MVFKVSSNELVYVCSAEGVEIYLLAPLLKIRFYLKVQKYASQISVLIFKVDLNLRNDCQPEPRPVHLHQGPVVQN